MGARRKVAVGNPKKKAVASKPKMPSKELLSKSKAKMASIKSAAAKSAAVKVKEEPRSPSPAKAATPGKRLSTGSRASTPSSSPKKTSSASRSPARPAVKKTIGKKVLFAPETKFVEQNAKTTSSPEAEDAESVISASNPIRVGAEALVAVGAALTAWFYPLFTANVASGR